MKITLVCIMLSATILTGCATKRHGRLAPLSDVERDAYSCEQIQVELAKVAAFQEQVAENSKVNLASVGAWLVDGGLGNAMERNAAGKTALQRQEELIQLGERKGCK